MMNALIYISFLISLIYIIINIIFYGALNNLFRSEKKAKASIKLSIIIAAKNEAENIITLLTKLEEQTYPKELFEIIVVDDDSNDDTFNLASSKCLTNKGLKVISAKDKNFKGKKGALDIGIRNASNPFILITDADCMPEHKWIEEFANQFSNNKDFVFGIAPYKKSKSFVNLLTRFENLKAHMLMFSLAKLGFPYSAAARSFGFSKKAFIKISGYKNTTETLGGDDDLLLREAVKQNLQIGMVTKPSAFVFTESETTFKDYAKQKSRHASTSVYYSLSTKTILAFWHFINLFILFSVILLPFNSLFIFPIFIKFVIDLFMANNFQNDFGYKINLFGTIALEFIYQLNLIYFFIAGFNFRNKWK